ncbi:hypothetical protein DFH09DRAFT_1293007 [Mycena vulgaris]|nr:hypothetical protein DFH09DRAFT_1293007 [Mycena vulgaris]
MVIWDDVRIEMKNLVDIGMMGKLLLSEKYPQRAYGNLALKTCVEEILRFELSTELTTSNWKAKKLTDAQIESSLGNRREPNLDGTDPKLHGGRATAPGMAKENS